MYSTDKESCNILIDVLAGHGIKDYVLSPGSRNAPLIVALSRRGFLSKRIIVDERSAAFVAVGMAQQLQKPVAIVCTSGTALLNYAPAVAEAYYQKIPLIIISADRPKEWIYQDDSQTIRQFEALSQFVKRSYDIPARCDDDTARWYVNRIANDAIAEATSGQKAPVHINIQIDEPLNGEKEWQNEQRIIEVVETKPVLSEFVISRLGEECRNKRVMILAGFGSYDSSLEKSIVELSKNDNVVVLTETIANIKHSRFISAIDRTLLAMNDNDTELYVPDVLITFGGAIVSRMIKTFLRKVHPKEHWHIGVTDVTVDCMQSLTKRILTNPTDFFMQFSKVFVGDNNNYSFDWHTLYRNATRRHQDYLSNIPWSDFKAFSIIFSMIPRSFRLQLSNGTTIRYAQLFGDLIAVDNHCNRGVSGIDGSTSTALGASLVYDHPTLLITGDMSFSYDLSGLASLYNSSNLKIIVIKNGGGGIFRFIKNTASLPELEEYFEVSRDIPVKSYADAFGFKHFQASSERELSEVLPSFFSETSMPAILSVITSAKISANVLSNYFKK